MFGKPLIQVSMIRFQEVEHAPILAQDAFKQQLCLAAEGLPEVVVEVGEEAEVRA